jgi:hypothetical protein
MLFHEDEGCMAKVLKESGSDNGKSGNYMSIDYDLIREPLNLTEAGRPWFKSVYQNSIGATNNHAALLLGCVDWMISMLAENQSKVFVVDNSAVMIEKTKQGIKGEANKVNFVAADWLNQPELPTKVDAVLADNCFNFIEYPGKWELMFTKLANMMNVGGMVFFRFFSVPASHIKLSPEEIVKKYRSSEDVNYTEVRTDILFSQWDPATYLIDTEMALACYEANRAVFSALLEGKALGFKNDLESIAKYRNTRSLYPAPPLTEILRVLEKTFHITQVHFGPYAFSQYFPLVVATKLG